MSKWIDKFKESNNRRIRKRIEKLKEELRGFQSNYNYFPKEQTMRAIETRQEEIDDLERLVNEKDFLDELEDKNQEIKYLQTELARIGYLATCLDASTKVADNNLGKLKRMTARYANLCEYKVDDEFMFTCDQGWW